MQFKCFNAPLFMFVVVVPCFSLFLCYEFHNIHITRGHHNILGLSGHAIMNLSKLIKQNII